MISTKQDLKSLLEVLRASPIDLPIPLDLETTGTRKLDGLRPWSLTSRVRLMTVKVGKKTWTLDLDKVEPHPVLVQIQGHPILIHNALFDLGWLRLKYGYQHRGPIRCTLTAARILRNGDDWTVKNDLTSVRRDYLGKTEFPKDLAGSDWSGNLTETQLEYAEDDVQDLIPLWDSITKIIEDQDLKRTLDLELDLIPVLVEMQHAGVPFSVDTAQAQLWDYQQQLIPLERMIMQHLSDPEQKPVNPRARKPWKFEPLNVRSTKQLLTALGELGIEPDALTPKQQKSLDAASLRLLVEGHRKFPYRRKLLENILAFRVLDKEISMLEALIDAAYQTGEDRIRCWFGPLNARTGRYSCSDPNLQQVPRGTFRKVFRVKDGLKLVVADLSQVEVRVAGAIAGDEEIIDAYRAKADLYVRTASVLFGVSEEQITKDQRQGAKAILLGSLYGQGVNGLVEYARDTWGLVFSPEQAHELRERFFLHYRGLKKWHRILWDMAKQDPDYSIITRGGRRRILHPQASEWDLFSKTANTHVQGLCADGLKAGMVQLHRELQRRHLEARIVATIHDEVVLESLEGCAEETLSLAIRCLEEPLQALCPEIPIVAEGKIVDSWAEK